MEGSLLLPDRQGKEGRIILIRHGQTAWNRQRYLGWEDIPLDNLGRQQARDIAAQLMDEQIDAIYSSPLIRAIETIRPLAEKRGLPVVVSDHLKEMCFGQWQGRLKSEHKIRVNKNHLYLPIPGGESLFDVYQRARRFMESCEVDLAAGRHLVITGHFRVNQMLQGIIYRKSFSDIIKQLHYRPVTGSLCKIRYIIDSNEH